MTGCFRNPQRLYQAERKNFKSPDIMLVCFPCFFKKIKCYLFLSWRRRWRPTPVLLPGESHGQRSLVGCSPWGRWGSGTTERLHFDFSPSCIGERNGNPLQCSCLENPRDGGAWWAATYGVAQSQTWLKWLGTVNLQNCGLEIQFYNLGTKR